MGKQLCSQLLSLQDGEHRIGLKGSISGQYRREMTVFEPRWIQKNRPSFCCRKNLLFRVNRARFAEKPLLRGRGEHSPGWSRLTPSLFRTSRPCGCGDCSCRRYRSSRRMPRRRRAGRSSAAASAGPPPSPPWPAAAGNPADHSRADVDAADHMIFSIDDQQIAFAVDRQLLRRVVMQPLWVLAPARRRARIWGPLLRG